MLKELLASYSPCCEQEENDKSMMLRFLEQNSNALLRENAVAHFTASAWVLNQDESRLLLIYHNIYNAWAWTGGHADGEEDLLAVAVREVQEETGIQNVRPAQEGIFSIEALTVDGHIKNGRYVSSHLHLNVTYLLHADDRDTLSVKPDENSGVRWVPVDKAVALCNEPWMQRWVYEKLNQKLRLRPL